MTDIGGASATQNGRHMSKGYGSFNLPIVLGPSNTSSSSGPVDDSAISIPVVLWIILGLLALRQPVYVLSRLLLRWYWSPRTNKSGADTSGEWKGLRTDVV